MLLPTESSHYIKIFYVEKVFTFCFLVASKIAAGEDCLYVAIVFDFYFQ